MDSKYKDLILSFIASLTLCDHMGDVSNEIADMLERLGVAAVEWNDFDELRAVLATMDVKTLSGISLREP